MITDVLFVISGALLLIRWLSSKIASIGIRFNKSILAGCYNQTGSERSFRLITLLHLRCHLRFVCQCFVFCFCFLFWFIGFQPKVSCFVFSVPSCIFSPTEFHLSLNYLQHIKSLSFRYTLLLLLLHTIYDPESSIFLFCFKLKDLALLDFWFCLLSSLHPCTCGGMFSLFFFTLLPASAPGKSFLHII